MDKLDILERFRKWGFYYVLLILILLVFAITNPNKTPLFIVEGIIWTSYMALTTLTKPTASKVFIGYTVALVLTFIAITVMK